MPEGRSESADAHRVPAKAEVEEIPAAECLALLRTKSIGRLVVVVADEPDIFTVNYRLDGDAVVIRTLYGLKLMQAVLHRVAFEVDEIDDSRREGWSVVVKGIGDDATDDLAGRISNEGPDALEPWVPGVRDRWIRIVPRVVTGRRIVHH
jgi:nitroimidazol reductase NimA-like FMN-containing flavoprotein (pyridoxamine 5'-phosphate oxidase superfamily)